MRESLVAADPLNIDLRLMLNESHRYVGDMLLKLGEVEQAAQHYRKQLALNQEMVAADPANAQFRRNQAVALIKKLGLQPRRTIRVVFWVNEENGTAGGRAYRAMLGDAMSKHVAAIEMDGGAEKPLGFGFGSGGQERAGTRRRTRNPAPSAAAFARVVEIGKLLQGIGGGVISPGGDEADTAPLLAEGVPGLAVRTVGTHYFDWHHTDADSFDKIVPREFQENVAALAVMTYVLADMPETLAEMK